MKGGHGDRVLDEARENLVARDEYLNGVPIYSMGPTCQTHRWGLRRQRLHSNFSPTAVKLMKRGRGVIKSGSHPPQVVVLLASMQAQVWLPSMLPAGLRDDPASDSTHESRVLVPSVDGQTW